jgi:uncharacterized protein (DUF1800 family)
MQRISLRPARTVLLLVTAALTSGALSTSARATIPNKADRATIHHVLDRITFGARPGDIDRVQVMGLDSFIDAQLHPERIADPVLDARLSTFPTLTMPTRELAEQYFMPAEMLRRDQQLRQQNADQKVARTAPAPPDAARMSGDDPVMMTPDAGRVPAPQAGANVSPELRQARQAAQAVVNELMQAKMLRAVMSERQLEAVLTDFWFNHFNVSVTKGQVRQYLTEYERDAIRPYVFGRFRDMLGAVAHSPAMLFYLDNWQSAAPNTPAVPAEIERRLADSRLRPEQRRRIMERLADLQRQPKRPARGLNENYAREIMELHTLGVDGGYTQKDVTELARILTGWTIDRPQQGGSFVFRPQMHDQGTKTFLGATFKNDGEDEGERALDMLAAHPSTARHIAFQLSQRLVADEPPAALVARAASTFTRTRGDLREVVRTIITSPEFFAEDTRRAKVKTPFEFVVSSVRATGAVLADAQPLVTAMRNLGMPLYACEPPTGYSMTADAWVNTGSLLNRMNFAVQLVSGGRVTPQQAPGRAGRPQVRPAAGGPGRGAQAARGPITVDLQSLAPDTSEQTRDHLVAMLLNGQASAATSATLAQADNPRTLVALALGSPEFQRR